MKPLYFLTSALLTTSLLTGCGNGDGDDLDQFIRDAGKDMQLKIKPLPEMKSYFSFEFNADGELEDPFKSKQNSAHVGVKGPDFDRAKEPMEQYPVESIKYVGMIQRSGLTFALLQTPDNTVQQVEVGNFIGQDFGVVTAIKDSEISLKEMVQDASTGGWVEQINAIALQE
jgi:type IV pilus assembly protein PilP